MKEEMGGGGIDSVISNTSSVGKGVEDPSFESNFAIVVPKVSEISVFP